MKNQLNIESAKKALTWVNSSKNIEGIFDRVLTGCANKKVALQGVVETPSVHRKDSFTKKEVERVEKASEWVREYLSWKKMREGESSGTQAFLDQLEKPLSPVDKKGNPCRRKHGEFPTAKTLREWVKLYETDKLSLAGNYAACGRPPKIADAVLLSAICAHAMYPELSVKKISEKMKQHEVLSKLPGLSPSTLQHWLHCITKSEWTLLQYGEKAHYQSSYGGRSIPAEMPGDLIQVDAGQIKVWVQNPETGELVYPYLTAAIDVKTRAYLGGVLTLDAPRTTETLLLLRNILLPRKSMFQQMLVHPERIQFDNGPIFKNAEIEEAVLKLNIDSHYIKGSTPTSNAIVERGFRLIGDEFASLFIREVEDRGAWGGIQKAQAVRFDVLSEELDEWLEKYNFARPHSKHDGATPAKIWRDLTAGRLYRPDETAIREAMIYKIDCRVDKNGSVEPVKGHKFDSDETRSRVNDKVTVRITPDLDYDHVYGKIEGDWVKLYSPHSTPGLSKKFAAEARIKKSGLLVTRKVMEIFVGTPRTQRVSKGKGVKGQNPVKPPKAPPSTSPKSTRKTPQSVGKASAIQLETFTLN